MDWLDAAIHRGVKEGVRRYLDSDECKETLTGIVRDMLKDPKYAPFKFIKQIQFELQRVDKTLPDKAAFNMASNVYRAYLEDDKVMFGDPDYDWTASGAKELAHAYEIDHWESA